MDKPTETTAFDVARLTALAKWCKQFSHPIGAEVCALAKDEIERLRSDSLSQGEMRRAIIGGLSLVSSERSLDSTSYGEIADDILKQIANSRSMNENPRTIGK